MLRVDRALETAYIVAGIENAGAEFAPVVHDRLQASEIGPEDFALIQTPEVTSMTETHLIDPRFGVFTAESGASAMRTPVRPDEIEEATILLYDIGATAELLARAVIWPFYGIKAERWTTEIDGSATITIVDGIDALEPVEAGFNEDLVRAWFILTEQPVVTHLLAIPIDATDDEVDAVRARLTEAAARGYAKRRDLRKTLLHGSAVEREQLVDFLLRVRYELDDLARTAAYSLIARGSGGTRFPLLREIPWRQSSIVG